MPTQNLSVDVTVIGSGPGGYVAAIRCAQRGLKTAIVEKESLGGTCLNWGCIPTKALIRSAERFTTIRHNPGGILKFNGDVGFEWPAIIQASRGTADRMGKGVAALMKMNKIEVVNGFGSFISANKIKVTGSNKETVAEITTKNTIIATGAKPATLPGITIDGRSVISSREAMVWPTAPKSMVIIGAGAIGLEFAYFYNAFGTKVTMLEYAPTIMPAGDEEVCRVLERAYKKIGVEVITAAKVTGAGGEPGKVTVTYEKDGKAASVVGDIALMATGVKPLIEGLNLEGIGVKTDKSGIIADNYCATNVKSVYAIGDVSGQPALAHVASAEAIVAAEKIAGRNPEPINYDNVPACVYCQPQVAQVGLTEKQARDAGYDVQISKFPFQVNGKSVAIGETDGFVKIVGDKKYGEILGAHIIGSEATEMITEFVVAKTHELTIHELHNTMHAHPTQSEAMMEAAAVWAGEAIHI